MSEREQFEGALAANPDVRFWNTTDAMFWAWQAARAKSAQAEAVRWGVHWGKHGDRTCVSIIKKHPDGTIEVLANEYEPDRNAAPQQAEATHQCDLAHRLRVHLANRHTLTGPEFKDGAEAILAEYYASPQQVEAVPPGYVLVPVEPTPETLHAVRFAGAPDRPAIGERIVLGETAFPFVGADVALRMYRAMIAAAPKAEAVPQGVGDLVRALTRYDWRRSNIWRYYYASATGTYVKVEDFVAGLNQIVAEIGAQEGAQ